MEQETLPRRPKLYLQSKVTSRSCSKISANMNSNSEFESHIDRQDVNKSECVPDGTERIQQMDSRRWAFVCALGDNWANEPIRNKWERMRNSELASTSTCVRLSLWEAKKVLAESDNVCDIQNRAWWCDLPPATMVSLHSPHQTIYSFTILMHLEDLQAAF